MFRSVRNGLTGVDTSSSSIHWSRPSPSIGRVAMSVKHTVLRVAAAGALSAVMISTSGVPASAAGVCLSLIPARPMKGAITNNSSVGVGVIHFADGDCTKGTHDTVLPPNQDTFHYKPIKWSEVAGVFV